MRIACLYLEAPLPRPETLRALAEACFRFSPRISLGERAIFLEIGACRRLFSEPRLMIGLDRLAKRFGFLSRVTFGGSAGEALALARNPGFIEARDLPLEALQDYAHPFAAASAADDPEGVKKLGELIQSLKVLGLKSIGELASLPPCSLASRFGKEAVKLGNDTVGASQGIGAGAGAWPGFHPSPRVIEEAPVESSESLEAILFVLRGLADRMAARLCGRGERVSSLGIRFELVRWGSGDSGKRVLREFTLQLPLAQGSAAALIPILRDYLGPQLERAPFSAPVDSIRIEALETVPGSRAQRDFFSKKEEEAEVWDGLVARLSRKLGQEFGKANGKNHVFVALPEKRYLPEKAYSRVLEQEAKKRVAGGPVSAPEWPPRPTRLLAQPRELGSVESVLRGRASLEGPERLSGEWWDSQYEGFNRDYYRLKTASGEELWVFLKRLKPRKSGAGQEVLYLHGYFD